MLNSNKDKLLQLREKLHEKELEIVELKAALREKEVALRGILPEEIQTESSSQKVNEKVFVQVVFNKESKKRYDYFLGKNQDIQVGDFVEVYANKTDNGKPEWTIAKVVYISSPGETSDYAKSSIKRKSDYRKW